MLVTVAVIGYFGYHYGSILLAGFKSAKASISSQTPVQDPGYPIDVDGQAPTNQVQADTEVVTEEVFKPTSAKACRSRRQSYASFLYIKRKEC